MLFRSVLFTKAELFFGFGIITAAIIVTNIYLAYRKRPIYVPTTIEADNMERYRSQLDPIKKYVFIGIAIFFFYFTGTSGMRLWDGWLQFKNATQFGTTDSQFHKDISFFAFKLPFYQSLISWGFSTLFISIVTTAIVHYVYGGIRLQSGVDRTTVAARVQLSVLLGLIVLFKAIAYWFDRYALAIKDSRLITGLKIGRAHV